MMLAASPFYSQPIYTPARPSPLSERSANVLSRPFSFTMAAPSHNAKAPVPQRTHKPNPVIQSRDAVAQRRREMFFRRVQKDRDDKKWDARGDQIQHLDFISSQKRWEAEKARQAPELDHDFLDEDVLDLAASYVLNSVPQPEQEMEEADYILAQEEYELEQLVASMEEDEDVLDTTSQHYGSDDEDYDQIFMECTTAADTEQPSEYTNANFQDMDAMDMTDG
ncbi:hypothetical protein K505DRAFT_305567 [Melanomma pulvis-pyrius CBS 109.77]|uniref:Uncharacterized protein n=1 Tax=Melanomma pulvis-pyrius CBS 109.77 TaxID=1314802 RepID=A0A6A6XCZ3_9PLEO|nr:hypothetical protein K505DRAFT_305567 [Melanomma pulvis-pyrius CBS 109.77]